MNKICSENCPDGTPHKMVAIGICLINYVTGYLLYHLKCNRCGKEAQKADMYEPAALYSIKLPPIDDDAIIYRTEKDLDSWK